ncbi:hypothetical protein PR202_ga04062 [Eleusine coracana subsp. coracana]|uniref:Uncharacterized protein n=1 Tax=Eleusine coracana subsp. coracana TaxID=191504 RepID=A0AAV5BR10_ELECO|nr:hypothetical protein PR202_ga04062 [Eleusine coracana subsp. coracana]
MDQLLPAFGFREVFVEVVVPAGTKRKAKRDATVEEERRTMKKNEAVHGPWAQERLDQLDPVLWECAAHVEAGSTEKKASSCLARAMGLASVAGNGPLRRLADCLARRILRPILAIADALIDTSVCIDRRVRQLHAAAVALPFCCRRRLSFRKRFAEALHYYAAACAAVWTRRRSWLWSGRSARRSGASCCARVPNGGASGTTGCRIGRRGFRNVPLSYEAMSP